MRFTIQLNSLPYRALDMASLTSAALSTVLARTMVSPRVTTQWDVRASWSSSGLMQSTQAAETRSTYDPKHEVTPSHSLFQPAPTAATVRQAPSQVLHSPDKQGP